jgi:hypothetical protein
MLCGYIRQGKLPVLPVIGHPVTRSHRKVFLRINRGICAWHMILSYVFKVSPDTSSTPVEIMPTTLTATTSLFCENHRCCLSSQAFEGLL